MKNYTDMIMGAGYSELMLKFAHERNKFVKSKKHPADSYYKCKLHGNRWWAFTSGYCPQCSNEAYNLLRIAAWEKRRGQHAVVSDLPFSEPRPV